MRIPFLVSTAFEPNARRAYALLATILTRPMRAPPTMNGMSRGVHADEFLLRVPACRLLGRNVGFVPSTMIFEQRLLDAFADVAGDGRAVSALRRILSDFVVGRSPCCGPLQGRSRRANNWTSAPH